MESRRQTASIVWIVALIAIMVAGTNLGWWPVSAVLANVIPYFIAAGIIGIFVWGFRDGIELWSSSKNEGQPITVHRSKLMTQFKEFAYTDFKRGRISKKPIELSWRAFIELFTSHKEFLQHLCTGHDNLYALLDTNQAKFEHDLDELIRGIEIDAKTLKGACDHCIELHDKKDRQRLRELLSTCA